MNNSNDTNYLRIGNDYFKITQQPLASGDKSRKITKWCKQNIKDDHLSDWQKIINRMPKYDGFCLVPEHINYVREKDDHYNLYEPISHKPAKGELHHVTKFLNHIFGEQIELGLDYLKLLLLKPTQILPVLCLVSKERNTGKTTLLNFLKAVFGENMTINTNEDFRNQFNSGWASKLLIGVDEVLLDRKEDSERIKNLSTTRTIKAESKGKDKIEMQFFGKFILCSNNETDFIRIDRAEIRYWVRKVERFPSEDPQLLEKLKPEIPAFLNLLMEREYSLPYKTRMWFNAEDIHTEALDRLKNANRSNIEQNILLMLQDVFNKAEHIEGNLAYTLKDINELYREYHGRYVEQSQILNILRDYWSLKPKENAAWYDRYYSDGHPEKCKGKFYELPNDIFKNVYDG